jgi:hypothetical protein
MGCGDSQSVDVIDNNNKKSSGLDENSKYTPRSSDNKTNSPIVPPLDLKSKSSSNQNSNNNNRFKSTLETIDSSSRVGQLDLSNRSTSSTEGFDKEYSHVITEKSDKKIVEKIEKDFKERNNIELLINGQSCPPLLSEKEKEIFRKDEEQKALDLLKQTGLIQKPIILKENSAQFEIIDDRFINRNPSMLTLKSSGGISINSNTSSLPPIKIPPRLLVEREKTTITNDMIDKKLDAANQRRQVFFFEFRQKKIEQNSILNYF